VSLPKPIRKLALCYVTDRKALGGSPEEQIRLLLGKIESAARAGVDWVQIREKDLGGRALSELVREALRRVPQNCRILVNDRLDVAYTAGAGGVHLGGKSLPVMEAQRFLRDRKLENFLVGASTHSLETAQAAEKSEANYVIFGPLFSTPSKSKFGAAQGVERLAEVCRRVSLPVMAIGGITLENAGGCVHAGAAGIAAIRLFQDATDLSAVVKALRASR
jgi:thiamine-phosphate pyrophosphorylase